MFGLIVFIIVIFLSLKFHLNKHKRIRSFKMPAGTKQLLMDHVAFYRKLTDEQKLIFENRIKDFLQHVTITGVGTVVEDIDRILIASGAIIVIFGFPNWRYNNISEVLLFKDTFNQDYKFEGNDRFILGMVGDGALQRQMLLSQTSVRASFQNSNDGHNTVIHEFAHLVDKADGSSDGIPEYLLSRPYLMPWINIMHKTIEEMRSYEHNDINFYGATNDAEFFAVVSEYFFEQPDELKTHHPELYKLLEQMFHPADKN
ncbi:MAG TPA: M90 family metallopeptidase [Chitinophagaceae bacterium]|nr:M90 family metallopeptidase [Chitinophagaceae bacterium]